MAKNILETKKRVAHFKNIDTLLGGNDCLVSTIIQEMNCCEPSFLQPKMKSLEQNGSKRTTLITQEDVEPNVHRYKKINSSKKFPLMEKTQRTLKQLRHNRKIIKPRAHLNSLTPSPANNKSVSNVNVHTEITKTRNIKSAKQSKIDSQKRTLSNGERKIPVSKKVKSDTTTKNPKFADKNVRGDNLVSSDGESDYEKFVQQNKKELKCKTIRLNKKQKKSNRGRSGLSEIMSSDNTSALLDSSKNEKFISPKSKKLAERKASNKSEEKYAAVHKSKEKNNSDLRDSHSTRLECHRKKRKDDVYTSSCESKAEDDVYTSSCESKAEDDDSDFGDGPSTSVLKCRRSKRTKRIKANNHAKLVPLDDSAFFESPSTSGYNCRSKRNQTSKITEHTSQESFDDNASELDLDADIYTRDSSGSDVPDDETIPSRIDDTSFLKQNCTAANKNIGIDNSFTRGSNAATPVSHNETVATKTCDFQGHGQDNTLENQTSITSSSNYEQHKQPDVDNRSFNNSSVSAIDKCEEILIDLCDSDTESNNTVNHKSSTPLPEKNNFVAADVKNESSDDSEIEILDIIMHEKNHSNKINNTSNSTNNNKVNIKTEKAISQPSLKTDIMPRISLEDLKTENSKLDASFITGICNSYTKMNAVNEVVPHSDSAHVNIPNVSVKREDDGIVIDSNTTKNMNTEVTNQTDLLKERELKLYEAYCNVKLQTTSFYENTTNNLLTAFPQQVGVQKDQKSILQEMKNEFATYLKIIHTEEAIGATFKALEQNQAKKLMHLKSLLESNLDCNDTTLSKIKKEIDSLMGKAEFGSKKSLGGLCEDPPGSSCDQSNTQQDLLTASSAVVERDVKPDATKLQTPKSPPRSPATNNMSFGEVCIICGKDAVAACQNCAKVFFCSNECGLQYWNAGHAKECGE